MRNSKTIGSLSIVILTLLISFQNCSPPKMTFQEATTVDLASIGASGILINSGALYTNNNLVNVQINVDSVAEMYVSNSPDCSSGGQWVPLTRQLNWSLLNLNTNASVYAKFRSTYGKETPCVSDSIIHDDILPTLSLVQAPSAKTNSAATELKFNQYDSGSGVDKLVCPAEVSNCALNVSVANAADGPRAQSYYVIDKAGNKSLDLVANWLVDRTPPVLAFVKKPATKTSAAAVEFEFNAVDTYSTANTFMCQLNTDPYAVCPKIYTLNNLSEGTYSINVKALDDLGNTSLPQTYMWTISRKLPLVNITKGPEIYSNVKGVFEFTGEDQFMRPLKQFECQLNMGAWRLCVSPFDLTTEILIEGLNKFKVRGADVDGLVSGEEERAWNYDKTAPVLTFETKPAAFSKNASEVLKVISQEAQGLKEIEFTFDGVVISKSLINLVTVNDLKELQHKISVVATDLAGNKSAPLIFDFWSDFTKPTLSFPDSNFPALPTPTASPLLKFQVAKSDNNTDPGNTILTYFSLANLDTAIAGDADIYTGFASPVNLAGVKNGSHQIKLYAVDKAGNQSSYYVSNTFLVDLYPPIITFISQPNTDVRPATTQTIDYLVQDSGSGLQTVICKLTIDGVVQYEAACIAAKKYLLDLTKEGVYVFAITAVDNVGNQSVKAVTFKATEQFAPFVHNFTVSQQSNNKVDILFVMDNSRTMVEENKKTADAFSEFLSNLGALDYRIAVKTTDVALSHGSLLPIGDSKNAVRYIDRNTVNALSMLQQTLQVNSNGSGEEAGLTSVQGFIDRIGLAGSYESSFYRSDAVLATVVITDSDEAMHGGYQSSEAYLADLNLKLPGKTYIHHSNVILPGDAACLSTGEGYGVTYFDLSKQTGGNSVSICSPQYGNQLKDFASSIIAKVSEQTLACNPIDQNRDGVLDIQISYTGAGGAAGTITNFVVAGNKVRFLTPLVLIGDYVINYYCVK